jgi:hypothetical protein
MPREFTGSTLAFVLVACGAAPPAESGATPPPETPTIHQAPPAQVAAASAARPYVVSNQCFAIDDMRLLHVRIDAEHTGGEEPAFSRVVWSVSCRKADCRGAKIDLDPWLKGKPLGTLNLNDMNNVELVEESPSGFVLRWGPRSFRVDLSKGEVVFEESGLVQQRGVAPCSQNGVLWSGK